MVGITSQKNKSSKVANNIPVQVVDVKIDANLAQAKLSTMLGALENNVSNEATALHITSAYDREGAERIALESALFAATQEGKNVLFIGVNPTEKSLALRAGLTPPISLDQFVLDNVSDKAPLIQISNTSLFYTKLQAEDQSGNLLYNARQLKELMTYFKTSYELIIIHSENAIKSGSASTLASIVDKNLIVIQADRTRQPVAQQLIDMISNSGGNIAGTVMTGRQYYIPKWVYKLFFNTESRD